MEASGCGLVHAVPPEVLLDGRNVSTHFFLPMGLVQNVEQIRSSGDCKHRRIATRGEFLCAGKFGVFAVLHALFFAIECDLAPDHLPAIAVDELGGGDRGLGSRDHVLDDDDPPVEEAGAHQLATFAVILLLLAVVGDVRVDAVIARELHGDEMDEADALVGGTEEDASVQVVAEHGHHVGGVAVGELVEALPTAEQASVEEIRRLPTRLGRERSAQLEDACPQGEVEKLRSLCLICRRGRVIKHLDG